MAEAQTLAGKWELAVQHWDERTSEPGKPYQYTRHFLGEVVELAEADARRLVATGAVVKPGAREETTARTLAAQLETMLASVPAELAAELRKGLAAKDAAESSDESSTPSRPALGANKDVWIKYAVSLGADADVASGMSREALAAATEDGTWKAPAAS